MEAHVLQEREEPTYLHPVAQAVLRDGRNWLCRPMSELFHLGPCSQTFPLKLAESLRGHYGIPAAIFTLDSWYVALITRHQRLLVDGITQIFILVTWNDRPGGIDFLQCWTGNLR